MDWFVTVLELAGAAVPDDRPIDGVSLGALLTGSGHSPRQVMPYYNGDTLAAVRKGPWKIHLATNDPNSANPLRLRPEVRPHPLLFHLEHDPSERYDVAHRHPEVVADLLGEADRLRREIRPERPSVEIARRPKPIAR
jgi:arylsulfatase A-like enzyme